MLKAIFGWVTSGALDRVLATVDKKISADTDREKIKAEIIKTHYETRASYMQAGGFYLMVLFAAPLAFWFALVCLYSSFWCETCIWPYAGFERKWIIAALPSPLDQWSAQIVISVFGVAGVTRFARR